MSLGIPSSCCRDILLECKNGNWWCSKKCQGITKVSGIHLLGTLNVSSKCHGGELWSFNSDHGWKLQHCVNSTHNHFHLVHFCVNPFSNTPIQTIIPPGIEWMEDFDHRFNCKYLNKLLAPLCICVFVSVCVCVCVCVCAHASVFVSCQLQAHIPEVRTVAVGVWLVESGQNKRPQYERIDSLRMTSHSVGQLSVTEQTAHREHTPTAGLSDFSLMALVDTSQLDSPVLFSYGTGGVGCRE